MKKQKIFRDKNGEYLKHWYFIKGKQKFMKIYIINGIPSDQYYEQNADPIALLQNGDYELLHEQGY